MAFGEQKFWLSGLFQVLKMAKHLRFAIFVAGIGRWCCFFSFAAWSSTTIPPIFIVSILVMDGFVCKKEDGFVIISLPPFVDMQLYTYLERKRHLIIFST